MWKVAINLSFTIVVYGKDRDGLHLQELFGLFSYLSFCNMLVDPENVGTFFLLYYKQ